MTTENKNIKWALLITGWGNSALKAIEAYSENRLKNNEIVLLIYETEPSGAVEIAKKNGIETLQIIRKSFKDSETYQDKICEELLKRNIDYVFLLAYKYIIRQKMLAIFNNRIANIHPSLFPSFLATKTAIQDALDYGVKVSGITTHIIDHEIDKGDILCQEVVKFKEGDNFESLYPKFVKKGKKIIIKTMLLISKNHLENN